MPEGFPKLWDDRPTAPNQSKLQNEAQVHGKLWIVVQKTRIGFGQRALSLAISPFHFLAVCAGLPVPRPWMDSLYEPLSREAQQAIRGRAELQKKSMVKRTISKEGRCQVNLGSNSFFQMLLSVYMYFYKHTYTHIYNYIYSIIYIYGYGYVLMPFLASQMSFKGQKKGTSFWVTPIIISCVCTNPQSKLCFSSGWTGFLAMIWKNPEMPRSGTRHMKSSAAYPWPFGLMVASLHIQWMVPRLQHRQGFAHKYLPRQCPVFICLALGALHKT